MAYQKVKGKMPDGKSSRFIKVDHSGAIIPSGMVTFVEYPFAKGDLTTTGVQYSAELTTITAAVDYVVEQVIVGEHMPPGRIVEAEFGLTCAYSTVAGTSDLEYRWRARSLDSQEDWVLLHTAADHDSCSATPADETYSGRLPKSVGRVPFAVKLDLQATTASDGQCKTKNSSYVRVKYIPD